MKIKVLKTTRAASCIRGISIEEYLSGEIYDMFDSLANTFIKEGWGEKAVEKSFKIKLENKAIEKVEEDKALEVKRIKKTTKKKGKK
jgi:hypothetical protein